MDVTHATFVDAASWKQVYGDVKEDLPPGMPIAKMKPIDIFTLMHRWNVIY